MQFYEIFFDYFTLLKAHKKCCKMWETRKIFSTLHSTPCDNNYISCASKYEIQANLLLISDYVATLASYQALTCPKNYKIPPPPLAFLRTVVSIIFASILPNTKLILRTCDLVFGSMLNVPFKYYLHFFPGKFRFKSLKKINLLDLAYRIKIVNAL